MGLHPRPRCGSLQRSPDLLAGFKRTTSKGNKGWGREGRRKGKERGRGGEVEGEGVDIA